MYRVERIAEILNPERSELAEPRLQIDHVVIDSRQIVFGSRSAFFAVRGERTDGHKFLADAHQKGVRTFVVHSWPDVLLEDSNVICVADTVRALQHLAHVHRASFSLPVIAITGSNGKTWVKEWLTQLLLPDYNIIRSPRSYNSQIGVALSLLLIRPEHELAIIEAGISRVGEMEALEEMIMPDVTIITGIGDAHNAGFKDINEKTSEKVRLCRSASKVICPQFLSKRIISTFPDAHILTWGKDENADLRIIDQPGLPGGGFEWQGVQGTLQVVSNDYASRENARICALTMLSMNYAPEEVTDRMRNLEMVSMRLEMHELPRNSLLINDAYTLDMASLRVALETLNQHRKGRQACIILSEADSQHNLDGKQLGYLLNVHRVDRVFGIGRHVEGVQQAVKNSEFYDSVNAFLSAKPWEKLDNTVFLLKGARAFGLEKIVSHMRLRSHSATLEIDLNAMLANLRLSVAHLDPGTSVIAMVKASAYGSGSIEVAKFLEHNNVDRLCVAYQDEGIELRRSGVSLPIMVLNPDMANLDPLADYRLEPEVYSFELLERVAALAEERDITLGIHVMIDTGMHRLGFVPTDIPRLAVALEDNSHLIKVLSVFTHLAAADDPNMDPFTRDQVARFEAAYDEVVQAIGYAPMRHVLNSYGTLRLPEFAFDAVRLGIGLYGLLNVLETPLQPVHRFMARVSQVRQIAPGESVSYGRAFVAERPTKVATLNAGYADGIPRHAGYGGWSVGVGPDHLLAPIIGSVCMDMTMLDVTDLPDVVAGDEVEIFGPSRPLGAFAEACRTIPYEILTGIGPRIPRVFKFD